MQVIDVQPISTKSVEELSKEVATITNFEVAIKTQGDYERFAEILKAIKAMDKKVEENRVSVTRPLDAAKAAFQALIKPLQNKLSDAERVIKQAMIAYTEEQERARREQEEKLRKQAEADAEKERAKLQAKADKAIAAGKAEKAEELAQQAAQVQVVAPTLAPTVETPKGISYREKWTATVVNFKDLPDEYKVPNQQALDRVAQAMKGNLAIPGVTYKCEKILSSRG